MFFVTIKDDSAGHFDTQSVGIQFRHQQYAFQAKAATCYAMTQPHTTVLVPQRAGVDVTFFFQYQDGLFPGKRKVQPLGDVRFDTVYTAVRVSVVDV